MGEREDGRKVEKDGGLRGKKGEGGGRKLTTLCTGIKPHERDFVDPILQSKKIVGHGN